MMLASRLMAKLKVRNLSALVAEDATTLLDAMNGGIKEWFDGLPPANKQTAVSRLVRAPVNIQVSVLDGARGFSYVTPPFPVGGYAEEEALVGCSVSLEGSAQINRLDASGMLLRPHLGSSGDIIATFWGDALSFPETDARIVSAPRWNGAEAGSWELLPMSGQPPLQDRHGIHSGPPTHYATEPVHPTARSHPFWLLRLWPLPTARGTVTFTLESTPPVLKLDSLQRAVEVPLPDQDIPDLLPLCEERLSSTPLWHEKADRQRTWADAARSRERLSRRWLPLDARPSLIQTPTHW